MASAIAISAFDKSMDRMDKKVAKWMKEDYKQVLDSIDTITRRLSRIRPILDDICGRDWLIYLGLIDQATEPAKEIINQIKGEVYKARSDLILGVKFDGSIGALDQLKSGVLTVKGDFEHNCSPTEISTAPNLEKKPDRYTLNNDDSQIIRSVSNRQNLLQKQGSEESSWESSLFEFIGNVDTVVSLIGGASDLAETFGGDTIDPVETARRITEANANESAADRLSDLYDTLPDGARPRPENTPPGTRNSGPTPPTPPRVGENSSLFQKIAAPFQKVSGMYSKLSTSAMGGITKLQQISPAFSQLSSAVQVMAPAMAAMGAVKAGTTVISAVSDGMTAAKAYKSGDKARGDAYRDSTIAKGVGTVAGGLIGGLLGPAGAMIGAGIGAKIGELIGNQRIKKYEEEERKQLIEAEQAKFSDEKVKAAIADPTISAEEYALILRDALNKDLDEHFGDIKLSMKEIQSIAKNIVFGDQIKDAEKFAQAAAEAEQSLANLQGTQNSLEKMNWKMKHGGKLSEEEQEQFDQEYKALSQQQLSQSQTYLEEKHYQGTAASDMLKGSRAGSFNNLLDQYYSNQYEALDTKGSELEMAIEAGDLKEIQKIQSEIKDLTTGKEEEARNKAQVEAMKNMDYESTQQLTKSVEEFTGSMKDQNSEAYIENLANLEKLLESKLITEKQYEAGKDTAKQELNEANEKVDVTRDSIYLSQLTENYSDVLGKSGLGKNDLTMDGLAEVLRAAKEENKPVETWDTDTLAEILKVSTEDRKDMEQSLMNTLEIVKDYLASDPVNSGSSADSASSGASTEELPSDVPVDVNISYNPDLEQLAEAAAAYKEQIITSMDTVLAEGVDAQVTARLKINYVVMNPMAQVSIGSQGRCMVSASVVPFANGGMVDGPLFSLIGEDGPEAIIPLGSKRRSRGLSLWAQAGEALGISQFAEGGIVGSFGSGLEDGEESVPLTTGESNGKTEVKVDVAVSPTFEIKGSEGSEENMMEIIKTHMKEMADALGGTLAGKLEAVFSNMPVKEV